MRALEGLFPFIRDNLYDCLVIPCLYSQYYGTLVDKRLFLPPSPPSLSFSLPWGSCVTLDLESKQ